MSERSSEAMTPNVTIVDLEWKKPLPQIDHDNEAFWAGLKDHKLLSWRCKSCGAWYWPKAYWPLVAALSNTSAEYY
jgi:hypothetical protein